MSTVPFYSDIQRCFFIYADVVAHSNSLGLSNETKDAEDFFCEFLNTAFGWKLVNANDEKKNQDSFDLDDKGEGIAIQVTSNKSHSVKLKNTVGTFKKHNGKDKKIKKLIILFISRKCSEAVLKEIKADGFSYESWDIPKLLTKIKQKNKLSDQLATLHNMVQRLITPAAAFFNTNHSTNAVIPPNQAIVTKTGGIIIDRANLVERLFAFSQKDNGLITGGPGMGKSSVIEGLHRYCKEKNIHCFIIRINELQEGSDAEIQKELNTNMPWLSELKKMANSKKATQKGLLIFDAFDTAKDEAVKSKILVHVKDAVKELFPGWNVLVSARTYDAEKSQRLKDIFPETDIKKTIECRHFVIPEFSDKELNEALKKHPVMDKTVNNGTVGLKALVKIPYFFKLLEKVIGTTDTNTTTGLSNIETEEQLLEIFWRQHVTNDILKDIFLRNLTEQLIDKAHLSCTKASIVNDSNQGVFHGLVSEGIITETSVTRQNVSFNHNILLEFAVAKYLISDESNQVIDYINQHQKITFLFRQSFIYFYSKLWKENNELFWQHYFAIKKIDKPLYRLFHQILLNHIVTLHYDTPVGLQPIFDIRDKYDKGHTIRKLLGAIRFTRKEQLIDKDIIMLEAVSKEKNVFCLWELGYLIAGVITRLESRPNKKLQTVISKTALNYLLCVLEERKIAPHKYQAERNGGRWAVENAAKVLPWYKAVGPHLKRMLEILKEDEFPIDIFWDLGQRIADIGKTDIKLALFIYKNLYDHVELSDKETSMNGSVIINLRSNRRQDFEMVHHNLEEAYGVLLEINTALLIPFGIDIANNSVKRKTYYSSTDRVYEINVNGIRGKLFADYSFYEPDDEKEHGPLSHVHKIFQRLEKLVKADKTNEAKNVIDLIISNSEASTIWRELIRFFTKYPLLFKKHAHGLLLNTAFFTCDETFYEAGELIKVLWRYLTIKQQQEIERAIIRIKKSVSKSWENDEIERRIAGLLDNIPTEEIKRNESKEIIIKRGVIKNEPIVSSSIIQPYYESEEEKLRNAGVDPTNGTEVKVFKQSKKIQEYTNDNSPNNTSEKVVLKDYNKELLLAEKLFVHSQKENKFNDRLQNTCDYEVALFARLLSKKSKLNQRDRSFVEKVAFHFIDKELYKPAKYVTGKLSDRVSGYSPNARTIAAETLTHLLENDCSGKIFPKILSLMKDNVIIVRTKALSKLDYYWRNSREDFWTVVKTASIIEGDSLNLRLIMRAISFKDVIEEDLEKVESAAVIIGGRLGSIRDTPNDDVWKSFGILLLNLIYNYKSTIAKDILYSNFGNTKFEQSILTEIIRNVIPPNTKNNYIADPQKHNAFFDIVQDITANRFKQIQLKGIDSGNVKDDLKIINSVVEKLFFSFNDGRRAKKTESKLSDNKFAFYKKVKPILQFIIEESLNVEGGFMVAQTGYYFMQLLNSVVDDDPEYVLSTAAAIVKAASATGFTYDQTTLKEIVDFTQKILADHKEMLIDTGKFDNLLTILDLFVDSGWQEAIDLTWRLKEIF